MASTIFPSEAKKLKDRISRYRRALKTDQSDGAGKRFLVGPMFLLLGDLEGAIGFYEWYQSAFPGDGPEPYNHLSWTLALFNSGRLAEAAIKLRQTTFSNLYLVPHLLGARPEALKIWHGSNWAELDYVIDGPRELLDLWDADAKRWAETISRGPLFTRDRERFIEIEAQLLNERPGPKRTALVHESFRIRDGQRSLTVVPEPGEPS